jgi:hypothetical protein
VAGKTRFRRREDVLCTIIAGADAVTDGAGSALGGVAFNANGG